MTAAKVPIHYIHLIAEELEAKGLDSRQWLTRNNLTPEQLLNMSLHVDFSVYRNLMADAFALTGDPAFSLSIGSRMAQSTHGLLGYATLNCGTLRETIEVLTRFIGLRTGVIGVSYREEGENVLVVIDELHALGDVRRTVLEGGLLSIKSLLDFALAGRPQAISVAMALSRPAYAEQASQAFRCEVLYDQAWSGFILPRALLDVPLRRNDPKTYRETLKICQQELEKQVADQSLSQRVRQLLLSRADAFPSLETSARHFYLTPRTLHRRLLEEGHSYREILEEVRRGLALAHLRAGRLSIQEIAYSLGYHDIANFRRAFKRWEGVPPSALQALPPAPDAQPAA
ncbi:AraC family transcriptional regulator [Pseudomonas sp. N040]|uniref:AraC family transcriptional regulator n=1 Tax=Pseudomonas sp. N040 TaxID=2785325 RepID=UPI0018A2C333|nr:AraC family transcriptional regulator [Pseudomonas sp. N040]MBF7731562.1 AraC family transcriptional regulator [Pseudomonas sp. N040]MBW7015206.1 AraC family transcriptional regulator [Pseudomonas sp. N040]